MGSPTVDPSADAPVEDSERQFRTLLGNLPGMAYRCRNEPDWPMEFVSEGCLALTGHPSDELTEGGALEYGDLILPEDREGIWDEVQEAVTAGVPFLLEYRIRSADGALKWVWERGGAVLDDEGQLVALEGFIMDVSPRREAEKQAIQAQRLESVGRLAGGVAHDFNNMLMVVTSLTELIAMSRQDDATLLADLEEIRNAADRAGSLTRQLLAFSGRQTLTPDLLDLNGVVRGLKTMLVAMLGRDVRLSVELDEALWPVLADQAQLEQILMNLAVNARDAMPDGGQLLIRTANVEVTADDATGFGTAPGPCVQLTVRDSGVGMDEATRQRIFEPFFTTKEADKGTGLGMATVHGIVQQSGGSIRVESKPGQGTAIVVVLPRAAPEAGVDP
jgi:two-component system, cell cycle sensor histidine kinase and response regulator CckA